MIDLHKNAKPYDTLDGFHPTAEGMKTIADAVVEECGKIYGRSFTTPSYYEGFFLA